MSAAEISEASAIPEDVIRDRFGLDGKHVAGPDDHVSTMGVRAAQRLLDRTHTDPNDVDVVAYYGSMWKDYDVWSAAPKIQAELGCGNAWAFEMSYVSCGAPVAVKVLSDIAASDPAVNTILAVGASREAHLLDYSNQRSRFMFNFGDGAAAALLAQDRGHPILGHAIHTDGRFADYVAVFGGGSRYPATSPATDRSQHYLDVSDPEAMKLHLDPVSGPNFVRVATEACRSAGVELTDLSLVVPIHTKRSFFDWIMDELGLSPSAGIYLRSHGHMSGIDPIVGLDLARDRLQEGDLVLLLAAGTGYTWAASVVRW